MNRPSERYEGRFAAPKQKKLRRVGRGLTVFLLLALGLVRLGAEALKLMAYADVFIGGGRMLIYGDVKKVDTGDSLEGRNRSLPVYEEIPEDPPEDDYILRLNDGTTFVYQGHTYELNRDLTTVLFLGIDKTITETDTPGKGGQSDVILLVGIDTKTGQTTVLNISRDAYAQVDVYSADGNFIETRFEQITLAYAYGNGLETSCENTARSVSRLLFGLPIPTYLALDMDGIMEANETVGGVKLRSLIDLAMPDGTQVREGDLIELHGRNLERYIRTRTNDLNANAARNERQKQYMTEFVNRVIAKSRERLTFPVDLFSTLSAYMVTNLDIPDVTFLSSTFLERGAVFSFRTIDGTYDRLNGSAVCYLDEVDLFEAMLQMFYLRVD